MELYLTYMSGSEDMITNLLELSSLLQGTLYSSVIISGTCLIGLIRQTRCGKVIDRILQIIRDFSRFFLFLNILTTVHDITNSYIVITKEAEICKSRASGVRTRASLVSSDPKVCVENILTWKILRPTFDVYYEQILI
jgi:hypothetical protein